MIDDGLVLAYVSAGSVQHEATFGVYLEFVRALETEHDLVRIRSGRENEVVLELALIAVVDEIDSGIDVLVADFAVGRHVPSPLRRIAADEVVRLAGELVDAACEGLARGAHEAHTQRDAFCIRGGLREHQHGFVRSQIEAVARTAREETHILVRLAAIRLELQRQFAVALAQASVRRRGCGQDETGEECKREHAVKRDQRGHGHSPFSTGRRLGGARVATLKNWVSECQRFMTSKPCAQVLRVVPPAQQLEVFREDYRPAAGWPEFRRRQASRRGSQMRPRRVTGTVQS